MLGKWCLRASVLFDSSSENLRMVLTSWENSLPTKVRKQDAWDQMMVAQGKEAAEKLVDAV